MALLSSSYLPVGRCIYCGATDYGRSGRLKLGDEHIIPFALGGDRNFGNGKLILPEASCASCEVQINKFEQPLLKGHFYPQRFLFGLKSRKKKPWDPLPPVLDDLGNPLSVQNVDHPLPLFLPIFGYPNILTGADPLASNERRIWSSVFTQTGSKALASNFMTQALDMWSFPRMLAKIGHAFAVATLGQNAFTPLLQRFILGSDIERRFYFIGGPRTHKPVSQFTGFHSLNLFSFRTRGQAFLISRVRLFAQYGAPTYYVVVAAADAP